MRSTQNWQTLRLERFGRPASLRSDMGSLLRLVSERDVVWIDVADGGARVVGQRRQLVVAAHAGAHPRAAGVEELDVVGDDLGGPALLPVLALPGAGLQAALDVDERALARVLADDPGQVPPAHVPGDDVVVVGELALLALVPAAVAVGRDAERGHRLAARGVAHLGIPGQAPDQHHLVEVAHGVAVSSTAPAAAAATGSGSAVAGWVSAALPPFGGRGALGSGFRTTRWRKTVSEILSVDSISGTRAGSIWKSVRTYWPSRRWRTSYARRRRPQTSVFWLTPPRFSISLLTEAIACWSASSSSSGRTM